MEKNSLLILVVMLSVMLFDGCSHTPTHRRVCGEIRTVPEFGFVSANRANIGNAPAKMCFLVGYHETGYRTIDGFVRWAGGATETFHFRMNINSDSYHTVFHPPGEGFKDAQSYADSMLKKRAIAAQEEAAAAARQQAEAQEKAAKDKSFWDSINFINSNPELFK